MLVNNCDTAWRRGGTPLCAPCSGATQRAARAKESSPLAYISRSCAVPCHLWPRGKAFERNLVEKKPAESIADWAQVTWPTISNFIFLSLSLSTCAAASRDESSRKDFASATAFSAVGGQPDLIPPNSISKVSRPLVARRTPDKTFGNCLHGNDSRAALFLLFVCTHGQRCEISIHWHLFYDALITAAHFLQRHAGIDCNCRQFQIWKQLGFTWDFFAHFHCYDWQRIDGQMFCPHTPGRKWN